MLGSFPGHAGLHEARGAGRAEDLAVGGDVVGVGVRDKRARLRKMRIEPPPDLGEPDTGTKFDLPRHGAGKVCGLSAKLKLRR